MKEIVADDYRVYVDDELPRMVFEGVLRLPGKSYEPISDLLQELMLRDTGTVSLDLRQLSFVNSAGINVLYKFAITLRKKGNVHLEVLGSGRVGWQQRSLRNLSHFIDDLDIQFT